MERERYAEQLDRARTLYEIGRYDLAITAANLALAADHESVRAYAVIANSYEQLGKVAEAEAAALQAVANGPAEALAHRTLGRVRFRQRRFGEAVTEFREGIRLDPDYADGYRLAAHGELARKRSKEALRLVDLSLELDPESIPSLEVRALVLQSMGRKRETETAIALLLRLDPENRLALEREGLRLLERGDREGAKRTIGEAIRIAPGSDFTRSLYRRAIVESSVARFAPWLWFPIVVVLAAVAGISNGGDAGADKPTWFTLYFGVVIVRRAVLVDALRRDDVSRNFIRSEIEGNGLTFAGGILVLAMATAAPGLHERAFTALAIGMLMACYAWQAAGANGLEPGHPRQYRRVAVAFLAFGAVAAGAVAIGSAYGEGDRAFSVVGVLAILSFGIALVTAAILDRDVITGFFRDIMPTFRRR